MASAAGAALRRLCRLLCGVLWVWCVVPCHDWPSHTLAASAKQKQTLLCSALRSCGTPHPFAHHPATATSVFRLLHLHSSCHAPCVLVRSCCLLPFGPAGGNRHHDCCGQWKTLGEGRKAYHLGAWDCAHPNRRSRHQETVSHSRLNQCSQPARCAKPNRKGSSRLHGTHTGPKHNCNGMDRVHMWGRAFALFVCAAT